MKEHTCSSPDLGPSSGCPACTAHLKHRSPCVCTIDIRTGAVVDYDCAVAQPVPVDMVNHPPHYTSHPSGIEAIEIGRHLTADWFNAFKYVFRADYKNGQQDIDKALWYAKDGTKHDIPIHAPTWRFEHQQKLQRVIDFETDEVRKDFFKMILIGNRSAAQICVEVILKAWPS